jgi:hypothetical protein
METEISIFQNSITFSLINIFFKPLSDHIAWCSFTDTLNLKKNPRDRGGLDYVNALGMTLFLSLVLSS